MRNRRHFFSYEEMCRNMAFDLGIVLEVMDGAVYENKDDNLVAIHIPSGKKTMWFETWLVIRERIEQSDFRFKEYRWSS